MSNFLIVRIQIKKKFQMKFLAGIGGKNARSLTTNMLGRLLLDDVAELYSFTGKHEKLE